jgi:hypothetical protein
MPRAAASSLPVACALACAFGACAQAEPGVARRQAPIVGGERDDALRAVVEVTARGGCSGTLVRTLPDRSGYVLSAAHCFDLAEPEASAGFWSAELERFVYRTATDIAISPDWPSSSFADIAVFRIEDVPGGVAPIPLLSPAEDDITDRVPGSLAGYGQGAAIPGFRHRIDGEVFPDLYVERLAFGASNRGGACTGDSGGAMLVETEAGPRLAGVISESSPPCELHPGFVTYAARVSHHDAFLNEFMGASGEPDDAGVSPVDDAGVEDAGHDAGVVGDAGSMTRDSGSGRDATTSDAAVASDASRSGVDGGTMASGGGCAVGSPPGGATGATALIVTLLVLGRGELRRRRRRCRQSPGLVV